MQKKLFEHETGKLLYSRTSRIIMGYKIFFGFILPIVAVVAGLYTIFQHFFLGLVFVLFPWLWLLRYKATFYPHRIKIFEGHIEVNGERIPWSDVSDVTLGYITGTIKIKSNKPRVPASIVVTTNDYEFDTDSQRRMMDIWRSQHGLPKLKESDPPWALVCILFICAMCIAILMLINLGGHRKKEEAKSKNLYKTEQKAEGLMLKK